MSQIKLLNDENSIWICTYSQSCDVKSPLIPMHNVSAVINLHMEPKDSKTLEEYKKCNIASFDFPIRDDPTKNILGPARHIFHKIDKYLQYGDVVVHCRAGVSRSPAAVTYYLVHKYNYSLHGAMSVIKKSRPYIDLNIGFWNTLYLDSVVWNWVKHLFSKMIGTNDDHSWKVSNLILAYIGNNY